MALELYDSPAMGEVDAYFAAAYQLEPDNFTCLDVLSGWEDEMERMKS